jgi:hypothetical protein
LISSRLLPFGEGKSAEVAAGCEADVDSLLELELPQAVANSASTANAAAARIRLGVMAAKGREGTCTHE